MALLLGIATSSLASAQLPPQTKDLVPQKNATGILFQCLDPGATAVYLAGDFNNWGNNTSGTITDASAKMTGPDAKGLWQMTVQLPPGSHAFKFCVNGAPDQWFAPDWATEHDSDGNAQIYVTDDGVPLIRNPVNGDWQPQQKDGKVTFKFYLPSAQSVYIAGDFNGWGGNSNGQVSDPKFLMQKSDDGVWQIDVTIPSGHHVYQFVVNGNKWQLDPNGAGKDDQNHSTIDVK